MFVEIVHASVRGRARFFAAALRRDRALGDAIERELRALGFVRDVHASALTGTVLVTFGSELGLDALAARIAEIVARDRARAAPESKGVTKDHELARAIGSLPPIAGLARIRGTAAGPLARGVRREVPWHTLAADEVLARTRSTAEGLTARDADERLRREGPNALPVPQRRSALAILWGQLTSVPVALLAGSALLSIAVGAYPDAVAILAVVVLNASIGYATESSAERILGSLESSVERTAVVLRDGAPVEVPMEDVVVGDLLVLDPGSVVPADARVIEAQELRLDESLITGESMPVAKTPAPIAESDAPLGQQSSVVFRGTTVTGGGGRAIVFATGAATEVGLIQELTSTVEARETPLQRQLRVLGVQLAAASGGVCVVVFGLGLLRGQPVLEILRTAISLAVAAIPEGLPTVAITTLTIGIRRMRARNVAIRHLAAVETLGAVGTLCLDKTGTITENRMKVVEIVTDRRIRVEGERFTADGVAIDPASTPSLATLLRTTVLCNEVEIVDEDGEQRLRGSPTEAAMIRAALDAGIDVAEVRRRHPLIRTRHRSESRNFMDTLHDGENERRILALKGRPTDVLARCAAQLGEDGVRPLGAAARAAIAAENERLSGMALRVLGVAFLESARSGDEPPRDLVFLGLVAMADPPRAGLRPLFERFRRAGIAVTMITGDQSATAHAIACAVGLGRDGAIELLDSTRLGSVSPEVLRTLARRVDVFARVSPAQKLQIVRALQRAGHVVGMTGDGINDSPALRAADVGIAMGRAGTEAARDVADVVLLDDELATMLDAVEEGRTIYDDIRKAVHFVLATNLSEVLLTLGATAVGAGQALAPMQLLWINMLTDVLPEVALAAQPPERDVLARPPRDPGRPMFTPRDLAAVGLEGVVITAGATAAFVFGMARHGPGPHARTLAFTSLTCAQLLHAISARSEHHSVFAGRALKRNPLLAPTLAGSFALQLLATFVPALRTVLGTTRLTGRDWGVAAAASLAPFLATETWKLLG